MWLSLVERMVRDHEAGGSNPLTPTIKKQLRQLVIAVFFCGEFQMVIRVEYKQSIFYEYLNVDKRVWSIKLMLIKKNCICLYNYLTEIIERV